MIQIARGGACREVGEPHNHGGLGVCMRLKFIEPDVAELIETPPKLPTERCMLKRDQILAYDGVSQTVSEWGLDYGISSETILRRLRQGMSAEKAITKPVSARPGAQLSEEDAIVPMIISFGGRALTLTWITRWGPASHGACAVIGY